MVQTRPSHSGLWTWNRASPLIRLTGSRNERGWPRICTRLKFHMSITQAVMGPKV
ncbi:hypothetical protein CGCA056_v003370 [Colletotrichum aenigma]|uniref:uncharacterized protein n=1 Tax=Colletotrichum aenigma TaxID=1215731 RepID=UPI0018728E80|nr:uncharacterized protein CGCA056_v003370 [Colletotrichum aenigma]KAF5525653.1 hypothetical protein CGCA056_v003370 [Colletotrichum aenigma]